MHIFDGVLDVAVLDQYKRAIDRHFEAHVRAGHDHLLWYPTRKVDISTDAVVVRITKFLQTTVNLRVRCLEAHLEAWPVGVERVPLRREPRGEKPEYEGHLSLNDDFVGGVLLLEPGIRITPRRNRLTIFDSDLVTGMTKVERRHQFTMCLLLRQDKSRR